MESAITVDDLSKRYSIGVRRTGGYRTLREAIVEGVTSPRRRLRRQKGSAAPDAGIHWALKDVSFQIQPGEVVGVIGRNGAGKSTLLKVLSRITEPHSGRVTLRGRVGSLLEVGVGFHQELTGRENIYLNGAIFGMSRREIARKFDEIVAFSEVEPFLDMPVKRYSSGMYVRLAFAVASHMEPEILLVDEVLAVGDAPFQKKCLGKMDEVSRSGRTVLFVSHNMATIINLCTKALVLERGRLIFDGDCDEGVAQYVSRCNTDCNSEVDLAEHPNRRTGSQPILGRLRLLRRGWTTGPPIPLWLADAYRAGSQSQPPHLTTSLCSRIRGHARLPAVHSGDLPDRLLADRRRHGAATGLQARTAPTLSGPVQYHPEFWASRMGLDRRDRSGRLVRCTRVRLLRQWSDPQP